MKSRNALDPHAIYTARAQGAVSESASGADLPALLKDLEDAMQAKNADQIRVAAAALGRPGSAEEGAAGCLFTAIGAAGVTAPDLASLDDLLSGMRSLIAVLNSLQNPASPSGNPNAAFATAVRARLRSL